MMKAIIATILGLVLSSGAVQAQKGNGTFVLRLEEAINVVHCLFVHKVFTIVTTGTLLEVPIRCNLKGCT